MMQVKKRLLKELRYIPRLCCFRYTFSLLDTMQDDVPRHKVQVFGLKASWTTNNRDVVLTLYDSFNRAVNLRKNLSSEALKGFKVEESLQTPVVNTLLIN
jgi:hypothetical protein